VEKEGSSISDMDAERCEAPASSPNRRARRESRERNWGGGGTAAWTARSGWLQEACSEVGWRIGEGGGAQVTRYGAADRWGRAATGPDVSGGVWDGEG
jgi:hypothetical protein